MSTWAAIAVKGMAVAATTAAGADAARAIAPGALEGFAAGALLTGLCFLVVVAPKTARARLAPRRDTQPARLRRARMRPDYYAVPADTHSQAGAIYESLPAPTAEPYAVEPDAEPDATESYAAELFADEMADVAYPVMAAPVPFATMVGAIVPPVEDAAEWESPALEPLPPGDPALEALAPAAQDYAGHAGADPYAPGALDPIEDVPDIADDFEPDDGFEMDADDDIVLPGDYADADDSRRGLRNRSRWTGQDRAERRSEPKRQPPRHAAPPSRFRTRMQGKRATVHLIPARG